MPDEARSAHALFPLTGRRHPHVPSPGGPPSRRSPSGTASTPPGLRTPDDGSWATMRDHLVERLPRVTAARLDAMLREV